MGYSEALKKTAASYDQGAIYYNPAGKTKEPVDFNKVFGDMLAGESSEEPRRDDLNTVSAGAAIDILSTMAQMTDHYDLDKIDFLDEPEELDSEMDFDEIAELDEIADDDAAKAEMEASSNVFGNTDIFDQIFGDDDELSSFDDFEELADIG